MPSLGKCKDGHWMYNDVEEWSRSDPEGGVCSEYSGGEESVRCGKESEGVMLNL